MTATPVEAEIDLPHVVEAELISMIQQIMAAHPRSLQTAIGPSEIGTPCSRALIHKLAGHTEPAGGERWRAQIGTFVHAGLQRGIDALPINAGDAPRYLLEQRVMVGNAAGQDIWGSADLFDVDSGTIVDWKIIGPTNLDRYRLNGPGPQYRAQGHLYGRGFALLNYAVRNVMIAFLPRDGALGTGELDWPSRRFENPGDRYVWSEPYDEDVALQALSRLNGLYQLLTLLGPDDLLAQYPPCSNWFCAWCSRRRR